MGEPITVYDAQGNEITMHGRAYVDSQIAAGVVFTTPPPAKPARVVMEPEEGPAPVIPPTKAVKRSKGKT
jgi:hypothetical protein